MNLLEIVERLVRIPSVSEQEMAVLSEVASIAEEQSWPVTQIKVSDKRHNILIPFSEKPAVVFSTHLDTVPETAATMQFGLKDARVYGRGSLDAKGIAACMICAAEKLVSAGETNFALLFVVGEETDGIGAKTSAASLPRHSFRYLINGEPTENTLSRAQRGLISGAIRFSGRACHSAFPELGDDANRKLILCASKLLEAKWPGSEKLGAASINLGKINGGVASNVVADSAEIQFSLRTISPGNSEEEAILKACTEGLDLSYEFDCPPVELHLVEGYQTSVFKAGSDVPNFAELAEQYLMYGPGDICLAHTDEESVAVEDLEQAVLGYVDLYKKLLA